MIRQKLGWKTLFRRRYIQSTPCIRDDSLSLSFLWRNDGAERNAKTSMSQDSVAGVVRNQCDSVWIVSSDSKTASLRSGKTATGPNLINYVSPLQKSSSKTCLLTSIYLSKTHMPLTLLKPCVSSHHYSYSLNGFAASKPPWKALYGLGRKTNYHQKLLRFKGSFRS